MLIASYILKNKYVLGQNGERLQQLVKVYIVTGVLYIFNKVSGSSQPSTKPDAQMLCTQGPTIVRYGTSHLQTLFL